MTSLLQQRRYSQEDWLKTSPAVYEAIATGRIKETPEPGFLMYGQVCKSQLFDTLTGEKFRVVGWRAGRVFFVNVAKEE